MWGALKNLFQRGGQALGLLGGQPSQPEVESKPLQDPLCKDQGKQSPISAECAGGSPNSAAPVTPAEGAPAKPAARRAKRKAAHTSNSPIASPGSLPQPADAAVTVTVAVAEQTQPAAEEQEASPAAATAADPGSDVTPRRAAKRHKAGLPLGPGAHQPLSRPADWSPAEAAAQREACKAAEEAARKQRYEAARAESQRVFGLLRELEQRRAERQAREQLQAAQAEELLIADFVERFTTGTAEGRYSPEVLAALVAHPERRQQLLAVLCQGPEAEFVALLKIDELYKQAQADTEAGTGAGAQVPAEHQQGEQEALEAAQQAEQQQEQGAMEVEEQVAAAQQEETED